MMPPGMPPMGPSAGPMPGAPPGIMPPGMMPPQAPGGMDMNALILALSQAADPVELAEQARGEQDAMGMSPMVQALMGMLGQTGGLQIGPGAPMSGMPPGGGGGGAMPYC